MKIKAFLKDYEWTVPVTQIDFLNREVEVDMTCGNGGTSLFSFDEVEFSTSGNISDGYHTFDELYFHRMMLFAVICHSHLDKAWKSWKHHDGSMYDDYFIVGITTMVGDYTYHYHKDYWNLFKVKEYEFAPEWDGHQPEDITRLLTLLSEER